MELSNAGRVAVVVFGSVGCWLLIQILIRIAKSSENVSKETWGSIVGFVFFIGSAFLVISGFVRLLTGQIPPE
jgi:hypothetical protein